MSQFQAEISLKFQPVAEANPPWSLRFFHHLLVKARQVEFALGVVQRTETCNTTLQSSHNRQLCSLHPFQTQNSPSRPWVKTHCYKPSSSPKSSFFWLCRCSSFPHENRQPSAAAYLGSWDLPRKVWAPFAVIFFWILLGQVVCYLRAASHRTYCQV